MEGIGKDRKVRKRREEERSRRNRKWENCR